MLTEHDNESVTLSRERLTVCLTVAWELEALAMVLPGIVPLDASHGGSHYVVRGMAGRLKQLAGVLMSGLGDSVEETKDLNSTVMVTHEGVTP
ncbi:MAG: hypothetical protein CO065_02380 [Comamonadaceae bacterium CG_4_9_14_0_8_um_filter_57_21]|nr:MAG: hypothetical protein CO065_02380 [Comamonadaceae bacterium CG_4_9_14_0_8_um_filter_57_21]